MKTVENYLKEVEEYNKSKLLASMGADSKVVKPSSPLFLNQKEAEDYLHAIANAYEGGTRNNIVINGVITIESFSPNNAETFTVGHFYDSTDETHYYFINHYNGEM